MEYNHKSFFGKQREGCSASQMLGDTHIKVTYRFCIYTRGSLTFGHIELRPKQKEISRILIKLGAIKSASNSLFKKRTMSD